MTTQVIDIMMCFPTLSRQYLRDNERVAMFKKVWQRERVYSILVLTLDGTGMGTVSDNPEGHL